MAILLKDGLGEQICGALGIEPTDTYYIKIELEAGKIGKVKLGQYLRNEQYQIIGQILKNYKLEPINEQS